MNWSSGNTRSKGINNDIQIYGNNVKSVCLPFKFQHMTVYINIKLLALFNMWGQNVVAVGYGEEVEGI